MNQPQNHTTMKTNNKQRYYLITSHFAGKGVEDLGEFHNGHDARKSAEDRYIGESNIKHLRHSAILSYDELKELPKVIREIANKQEYRQVVLNKVHQEISGEFGDAFNSWDDDMRSVLSEYEQEAWESVTGLTIEEITEDHEGESYLTIVKNYMDLEINLNVKQ